jgi:hypothetical protein
MLQLLQGDVKLLVNFLLIVGIVFALFAYIGWFIKNAAWLLDASAITNDGDSAPVPIGASLLLLLPATAIVWWSCRGALNSVARVKAGEKKRAEEKRAAEEASILDSKPKAPVAKTGKKGRRRV